MNYAELLAWTGEGYENGLGDFLSRLLFYYHSCLKRCLTDGIDGLAAGTSEFCFSGILLRSGNIIFSII
jgi:hypothetical protein